ncbi:MAG: ketopantoate reductase family protein [Suilimivivens sp.]
MRKITIVGMGALGILYGDMITSALGREAVTFLADERRIRKYEKEGVFCNGSPCDFQMSSKAKPVELLIFAVKGTALKEAMELAADAVGEDTIILSLLNGISSEEILAERFPKGHIIHCIAQGMDAVKLGNQLTYAHKGELRIGTPYEALKTYLDRTVEILKEAGIPYVVEEDILHRLWGKWMLNVGVNQVVMVTEGTYGTIQKPGEARDMMLAAMEEVRKLSEYAQTGVTKEDMEAYVALVDTLNPDGMPSMRQDGISKRYSEVDFFAGTVIEKAKQYGLEVPVNRMLYDKVKEMEARY